MTKVKVTIRATQKVHYDQTVVMDEDKYKELSSIHYSGDLARALSGFIDTSDVIDTDEMEDGEIYIEEE